MTLLAAVEVAGFAAVAAGVAVAAHALAGGCGALAAGLVVGGGEAVYLVREYAAAEIDSGEPAAPDA